MSNKLSNQAPNVMVVGGGNAALCAAITASRAGARVTLLEAAPKSYRGGNSRHTRNFRCMHSGPKGVLVDSYSENEFYDDLIEVTKGNTDETLARKTIQESYNCYAWMESNGVHFQPPLSGTLSLNRTNAFFLGGGKALVNAYYRTAMRLGIEVFYDSEVTHLEFDNNKISWLEATISGKTTKFSPQAVVVASGGFEANLDWLANVWGPSANNFLVRGSPYNTGLVLKDLLNQGIESIGDPAQCHAVAVDGRASKFDGGIVTRLDCVPFSIVVNKNAKRFYDEGEDVWPKRYAIWGRLVAVQPNQVAYAIIDSNCVDLFMPSVYPPVCSDTISGLGKQLGLPVETLQETIGEFNQSCQDGTFHPTKLDGLSTRGLSPGKSNWARPIANPPYFGYELRTGVTFTYLGLKVDSSARVQSKFGSVKNLWAAGEIMAGSILGQGYLAGFGMTMGTVFGRVAGKESAEYAKRIVAGNSPAN